MPRFVSILLVVITLGSVSGLAWMLGRPSPPDLRGRVASLEADLSAAQKEVTRLKEQLSQRAATSPAVASAGAGVPEVTAGAGGATAAPGAGPAPAGGANLREVLATPGMRAIMEQQQAVQIDMGYGRLFGLLQLNDAEKANFRQLLLEREKGQTEFALKMMDPNLTPEKRQQLAAEMQAARAKFDDSFKTFLNDSKDYATFKQWEDTQPERVQFDMMGRSLFAQSGEPLSAEQEQQLINTAAEVRKTPNAASDIANPANMNPAKMTEASMQNYLDQLKKNDDQVAAQAANFLTPTQLKTLQTYQEQARNMAMTGIKMSAALSGGQGGK